MNYGRTLAKRIPREIRNAVLPRGPRSAKWLETRLWKGFSATAADALHALARNSSIPFYTRFRAQCALARWYHVAGNSTEFQALPLVCQRIGVRTASRVAAKRQVRHQGGSLFNYASTEPASKVHVDVVMLSHFGLKGGTTSSNIQEIAAQLDAGLTTGLVHHPVWDWAVTTPINERIEELVDGDRLRWIDARDEVTCEVLVIRAPKMGEVIMDELPHIKAKSTVVIVNQPPYYYYGDEPSGVSYDLPRVFANLTETFGPAKWFPIGPSVREALTTCHGDDMDMAALASDDWVNIIDAGSWKRSGERERDGVVRIGRHSRDHPVKWPERGADLRACYPEDGSLQVHVLGGAEGAREVLGVVPKNWVVHPFGSMDVRKFLHGLDVYVYFTASTYVEAFGRAPLEAMAVGLPVVLPPSFEPLFGAGAVYCEPSGVADAVRKLTSDPDSYARASRAAFAMAHQRFGFGAHVARLAALTGRAERHG